MSDTADSPKDLQHLPLNLLRTWEATGETIDFASFQAATLQLPNLLTDPNLTPHSDDAPPPTPKHPTHISQPHQLAPDSLDALPTLSIQPAQHPQTLLSPEHTTPKTTQHDLHITRTLGHGGMGVVRQARQHSLARLVAVKSLREDVHNVREAIPNLLHEAVLTGQLEHPNITPVHTLGRTHRGLPIFVMKYIEGCSWLDLVDDPKHPLWHQLCPDDEPDARLHWHLQTLLKICDALSYAHSKHIIHRDIKLDNVMIGSFGEVVLVDWGLGLVLNAIDPDVAPDPSAPIVGTPAYMSPEMVLNNLSLLGPHTDVYLLGATLHHILCGHPPHTGNSVAHVLLKIYERLPVPPIEHLEDPDLQAILDRALAPNVEDRFQTIADLQNAIRDYLTYQTSIQITRDATALLDQLHPLLNTTSPKRQRLFDQARFGLMLALKQWPENQRAQETLQTLLTLFIRSELSLRNLPNAQNLLSALPTPDPQLEREAQTLQNQLHLEHKRTQELERAQDLSIGHDRREIFVAFCIVVPAILSVFIFFVIQPNHNGINPWLFAFFPVLALAIVAIPTWLWRSSIFSQPINRNIVLVVFFALFTNFLHRTLYLSEGTLTNINHALAVDLLIFILASSVLGVIVHRYAFASPLFGLFGFFVMFLSEDIIPGAFSAVTIAMVSIFFLAVRQARLHQKLTPSQPSSDSTTSGSNTSTSNISDSPPS